MELRRRICEIINDLSNESSLEEVSKHLNTFLEFANVSINDECHLNQDGEGSEITPLLLACDKGHASCLEFMVQHPHTILWGDPKTTTSHLTCGANTALHHAGMTGSLHAIDVVVAMGCNLQELLQITNVHGDTTIMMACVYNQVEFLQKLKSEIDENAFSDMLHVANKSGDTPLILTFGYGHKETLNFLLESGVRASYEAVSTCKQKEREMRTLLENLGTEITEDMKMKLRNVKHCLVILEVTLAKETHESFKNVLQSEEFQLRSNPGIKVVKKMKRKPKNGAAKQQEFKDIKLEQPTRTTDFDLPSRISLSHPRFRTLADGSIVKPSKERHESENHFPNTTVYDNNHGIPKSMNQMFRDRLREPNRYDDMSIDAMMDSLCLDASMLLFNDHNMAMNLSPSQLEMIESILHRQVMAVHQAKQIQEKLLKTGD
jgi:hypothetical protein